MILPQSPEALKLAEEIADLKAQIKVLDPVCHPSTLGGAACSHLHDERREGMLTGLSSAILLATQVKDFVKVSKVQRQMIKKEKAIAALSAEHRNTVSRLSSLASDLFGIQELKR